MAKRNVIKKMAGKERAEADHAAAKSIVEMETTQGQLVLDEAKQREAAIARCHEVIGRIQGLGMVSKFADVSNLMWLKDVKEQKIYRDLPNIGTWQTFCDYIGLSRQKVDEDLLNLRTFGEAFLADVSSFRVGYRELRKLRQIANAGDLVVDAGGVTIGDETIPFSADNAEDLQAAIEGLLESKSATIEDQAATIAAKDKILGDKEKLLNRQEKSLARLEGRAKKQGLTAEEEAVILDCDNARVTIDGFLARFDPEKNPLPDDATPRMQAAYMETLGYFRRVVGAAYDTAAELYGDPETDDGWLPPHLRGNDTEPAEA